MRIIAGDWKGIRLDAPHGDVARPTTDRVKESMFSLLGIHWDGGLVLDLFAGSGALGLEALSRGADYAIFTDKSEKSIRAIRENIARCKAEEYSTVVKSDFRQGIQLACERREMVQWVFVDPPYPLNLWTKVLEELDHSKLRVQGGVVCEHPRDVVLPQSVGSLQIYKAKQYGDITVTIYDQLEQTGESV